MRLFAFAPAVLLAACAAAPTAPSAPTPSPPPARATPAEAPKPAAPATQEPSDGSCGPLDCRTFATPADALAVVLATKPKVLGVGEAHAQRGTNAPSTTKRFTTELLPALRGQASDLLVELMLPPKGCRAPEAEKEVRKEQAKVTAPQAESNQNEYVALGEAARAMTIVPDGLRPSCDDLDALAKAGEETVPKMLGTIARLAAQKARALYERNLAVSPDKLVVVYGGAMHNDLPPAAGREAFSFGPALAAVTGDRYVALDVFAPESIGDSDTWKSFAWYPHYDAAKLGGKAVLYRLAERSFVLILPRATAAK